MMTWYNESIDACPNHNMQNRVLQPYILPANSWMIWEWNYVSQIPKSFAKFYSKIIAFLILSVECLTGGNLSIEVCSALPRLSTANLMGLYYYEEIRNDFHMQGFLKRGLLCFNHMTWRYLRGLVEDQQAFFLSQNERSDTIRNSSLAELTVLIYHYSKNKRSS